MKNSLTSKVQQGFKAKRLSFSASDPNNIAVVKVGKNVWLEIKKQKRPRQKPRETTKQVQTRSGGLPTMSPTWKILNDALSSYAVFCCSTATARLASAISHGSASLACRWSKYMIVLCANGLKTSGICGCRPYRRRNGEIPVDEWTAVWYTYRARGRWHSQSFCFFTYTLRSCKNVRLNRSTIPSPWGGMPWYATWWH